MSLIKNLRPRQVCFRNCKNPSTHRHAPSKQLLFATLIAHCSDTTQSYPKSVAKKYKSYLLKPYIFISNFIIYKVFVF